MRLCPDDKSEHNSVRPAARPIVGGAERDVIGDVQANRSPDRCFRSAPLGRLRPRQRASFFRDRRFGTLRGEIGHSNGCKHPGLTE
jgi:hypothetical protein